MAGAIGERASGETKPKVPPELAAMISSAVDNTILPATQFFSRMSEKTTAAVHAWCAQPSPQTLQAARDAFSAGVQAWARIQHIRFGPARTDNRWQRIAFLPDPRGVARRQVAKLLAERPQDALTREGIATQSAALQGLPAMEILLFSIPQSEPSESGAYRCRLGHAIALHVSALAAQLADDWTSSSGWRQRLLSAGPGNADYASANEAASELVRSHLTGLQLIREEMLLPWLKAAEARKPWGGLAFELSGNARQFLSAALLAQDAFYKALHLDLVVAHLAETESDKRWLRAWVPSAYQSLERDSGTLVLPAADALDELAGEPNVTTLKRMRFNINALRQVVGRQVAPASALTIGFNELDGD